MESHFKARYHQYHQAIEKHLNSLFQYDEPQQILFSSMRYSLLAGGKRLRPIFVYDFCHMCGGEWEKATHFAAALEMVHTYSLIHDDLPCMDNDDYRRGKLTNHKVFGEATAILAGDALLTAAFSSIVRSDFEPQILAHAVKILSDCAGECGMVGGQMLDIMSEQRQCTEQEVRDIQSRKTGALIRAGCMLGVLAGNGTESQLTAAAQFADHLGLAFQIRDDMLDVIGDAQTLGKNVGVDGSKNTFLQLYGLDLCDALVRDHTNQATSILRSSFSDTAFMEHLSNWLTGRTM